MSKHGAVRESLRTRLDTLLARVDRIERDLRRPHDDDWQERATEVENDEVLEGLDEMSRREAQSIRAALKRIDDGKYGLCATCGEPIGEERLKAVPTAATCIWCAR